MFLILKGFARHTPRPLAVMSSPTSPGDIATRVGLDAKELDRPCEESLFPSFANYVHPWRLVFADLLALIDLDDVDLQCHSEQEKRLGCLRTWKARNGAKATVGAVVGSVLRNGSVDNAESMCRCLLPGAIIQNFGMTIVTLVAFLQFTFPSKNQAKIINRLFSHH